MYFRLLTTLLRRRSIKICLSAEYIIFIILKVTLLEQLMFLFFKVAGHTCAKPVGLWRPGVLHGELLPVPEREHLQKCRGEHLERRICCDIFSSEKKTFADYFVRPYAYVRTFDTTLMQLVQILGALVYPLCPSLFCPFSIIS